MFGVLGGCGLAGCEGEGFFQEGVVGVEEYFFVGEGDFFALDFLVGFVAFTGDQEDVVGLRQFDCQEYGLFSVGFNEVVVEGLSAFDHFLDDVEGVFVSWVVAGEDSEVCQLCCDCAHFGSFLGVAIAAASDDHDEFVVFELAECGEYGLECVGCVGVVYEGVEGFVDDGFESAGWGLALGECFQFTYGVFGGQEVVEGCPGGEYVVGLEVSGERESDPVVVEGECEAAGFGADDSCTELCWVMDSETCAVLDVFSCLEEVLSVGVV